MTSGISAKYDNQILHQRLLTQGYTPKRVEQVPRFDKIYDKVTYAKPMGSIEAIARLSCCIIGSLVTVCCLLKSKTFLKETLEYPSEGESRDKLYFPNEEATRQFLSNFKERTGIDLSNKSTISEYMKKKKEKKELLEAYGHYYYPITHPNGATMLLFAPNKVLDSSTCYWSYDNKGKPWGTTESFTKAILMHCITYNSLPKGEKHVRVSSATGEIKTYGAIDPNTGRTSNEKVYSLKKNLRSEIQSTNQFVTLAFHPLNHG